MFIRRIRNAIGFFLDWFTLCNIAFCILGIGLLRFQ